MNPTQQRDRAFALARTDPEAALPLARAIPDPWFKAQALAAVARWSPSQRVEPCAREALAAAEACEDDYKRAAVAAWPIRALLERGREQVALAALGRARDRALEATPAGSQAEPLLGLLQGAWSLGAATRGQLVEDLVALHERDTFWRVGRAVVTALAMLSTTDPTRARALAARVRDDRCRAKAQAAIERGGSGGPREYFGG